MAVEFVWYLVENMMVSYAYSEEYLRFLRHSLKSFDGWATYDSLLSGAKMSQKQDIIYQDRQLRIPVLSHFFGIYIQISMHEFQDYDLNHILTNRRKHIKNIKNYIIEENEELQTYKQDLFIEKRLLQNCSLGIVLDFVHKFQQDFNVIHFTGEEENFWLKFVHDQDDLVRTQNS